MLKCIAIDDEPLALRQLKSYIEKIPYLELTATCNNALEAQQLLASQHVDLIFVDINMPDLNGVDFVRALPDRPMVIFTTAYSEYAVEGFKLDAVDYLLKPFSFADFSRSAAKANSLYELRQNRRSEPQETSSEATPRDKEYISVKADYKVSLVRIAEIIYLESEGEYVRMSVRDHGPGVAEEDLPHVKERFYKGRGKERGSGRGLAVCDEIVTRHGGRLTTANAEGGGALVSVELPIKTQ